MRSRLRQKRGNVNSGADVYSDSTLHRSVRKPGVFASGQNAATSTLWQRFAAPHCAAMNEGHRRDQPGAGFRTDRYATVLPRTRSANRQVSRFCAGVIAPAMTPAQKLKGYEDGLVYRLLIELLSCGLRKNEFFQ
ncbi:MAG: hypothetical protein AAF471_08215 [Myxococcota bacterium]